MTTPTSPAPIGVFDSGVGGLSVWREIVRQLPHEDTLYVADQAHIPYGPRPLAEVRGYAEGITHFLLERGARVIVVACNTASGAALHSLRATFPRVPFVGMEPAVKPAAECTRSRVIGVIATPATFQGDLFQSLVTRFAGDVDLRVRACPDLVGIVEAGALDTPETEAHLRQHLAPMLDAGVDQLVLGCTHFPFLRDAIQRVAGPGVALIDPAPAVARQVRRVLARQSGHDGAKGTHRFYTTGDPARLAAMAERLVDYKGPVDGVAWVGGRLRLTPF
jgi:glutamate racemase